MKTILRFFKPNNETCIMSIQSNNPVIPRVCDNVFLGDDVYSVHHLTYEYDDYNNSCMVDVMLSPYPEYYDDYDEGYATHAIDCDEPCVCNEEPCGEDKKEHDAKYNTMKKRLQSIVDMFNEMGIQADFEISELEI